MPGGTGVHTTMAQTLSFVRYLIGLSLTTVHPRSQLISMLTHNPMTEVNLIHYRSPHDPYHSSLPPTSQSIVPDIDSIKLSLLGMCIVSAPCEHLNLDLGVTNPTVSVSLCPSATLRMWTHSNYVGWSGN